MRRHTLLALLMVVAMLLPTAADARGIAPAGETSQAGERQMSPSADNEVTSAPDAAFASSPVMFIENRGQWNDDARFQVWGGPAATMWLAQDAIWLTVLEPEEEAPGVDTAGLLPRYRADVLSPRRGVNIKLSFAGANRQPRMETIDPLDTTISYFDGNDPDQWRPDVPVWGGVRYVDLYPGVDLELTGEDGQLALRLAARTDADLSAVRLRVGGADAVTVDEDHLRLATAAGAIDFPLLQAAGYLDKTTVQSRGAQQFEVSAPFVSPASKTHFPGTVPHASSNAGITLAFSTFLGGTEKDLNGAMAVDHAGNPYVAGETWSEDFPVTPGAFATNKQHSIDLFVAKMDPFGSTLVYSTFLGGSSGATAPAIVVDAIGNAYITASTRWSDFPVTPNAFDTTHGGGTCGPPPHLTTCSDAVVVKLDPTGSALVYSTFLGSENEEVGADIDVDEEGNAYVISLNLPNDQPSAPAAYDNCPGNTFIAKLNQDGSALTYCSYAGDQPQAIAVDDNGSAFVAGNGGNDVFVAKLNPAGSELDYETYIGGSGSETLGSIAIDSSGNAYITGNTRSSNFPVTPGAYDTTYNGNYDGDAFVVKLNPAGSALDYSTFLGGTDSDYGSAIAVNRSGIAFVLGTTYSSDFPTTPDGYDTTFNDTHSGCDVFVAEFNPSGSTMVYGTFLGGNHLDFTEGDGIALNDVGSAYVTGSTMSDDFPTTPGAFDTSLNWEDVFVAKLNHDVQTAVRLTGLAAGSTGHASQPESWLVWAGVLVFGLLALFLSNTFKVDEVDG
ncbi:MAG: SBBP repeat-containing protein [Anaerolineae bacterium]|nr:SBBP repeat-containing protein [Anaerolineae bacterium]